jgi:hypothetical protein
MQRRPAHLAKRYTGVVRFDLVPVIIAEVHEGTECILGRIGVLLLPLFLGWRPIFACSSLFLDLGLLRGLGLLRLQHSRA